MGALPSLLILGTLALVSVLLARTRPSAPERSRERYSASVVLAVATVLQAVHFTEELIQGFRISFPEIFGLAPVPFSLFVIFNLGCLMLWIYAIFGIKKARKHAFGAAWFLALAGILNGIAHPVLALTAGTYFPGLYSSLPVAVACCWLVVRLLRATRPIFPDPYLSN